MFSERAVNTTAPSPAVLTTIRGDRPGVAASRAVHRATPYFRPGAGLLGPRQDHRRQHLRLPLTIIRVAGTTKRRVGLVVGERGETLGRHLAEDLMSGDEVTELVDDDLVAVETGRVRLMEEIVRVGRSQPEAVGHPRSAGGDARSGGWVVRAARRTDRTTGSRREGDRDPAFHRFATQRPQRTFGSTHDDHRTMSANNHAIRVHKTRDQTFPPGQTASEPSDRHPLGPRTSVTLVIGENADPDQSDASRISPLPGPPPLVDASQPTVSRR